MPNHSSTESFSKWGPRSPWELVRNADPWVHPRPLKLETPGMGWVAVGCVLTGLPGDSEAHRNHCSLGNSKAGSEIVTGGLLRDSGSLSFVSKCTRRLLCWYLSGVSKKCLKKEAAAVCSGGQVPDRIWSVCVI